jgi:hypothetical protein
MLGSLLAGFVLLPLVGMEASFFLVACGYGALAVLAPRDRAPRTRLRTVLALALAAALLLFPWGALRGGYVRLLERFWLESEGMRVVAVHEGLSETVLLLRRDSLGRPLSFRLLTNGMSMSTTEGQARRYMGLFVWLPVALHPEPRSALVISHGLGNTARALAATRSLERIDVVDVSPDVLRLSPVLWPEPGQDPLADPRVRVHVEDGRFHLLATRERYDLVTGEPPPPKAAGIGNLYSREYFALMRARLREGGIASYWLPVLQLEPRETLAITRGFCEVFSDCSLWTGWGHEWILLGSRDAHDAPSPEGFARQWSDSGSAASLRAAGFESPAQLGATFLADAGTLATLTAETPPLVDDHPYRIDPRQIRPRPAALYARIMEPERARERFRASAFVRRFWPERWVQASLPAFEVQRVVNRLAWASERVLPQASLADQEAAIRSGTEAVALWSLGSSFEEQQLAESLAASGAVSPELHEVQGLRALARRRFGEAESLLARAEPHAAHRLRLRRWRILAAELAGDREAAGRLLAEARSLAPGPLSEDDRRGFEWLARRLRLPPPAP